MKNTNYYSVVIFAIVIFAMVSNCKKNDIENPYGNYSTPKLYEEPTLAGLPTDNFGYLHATVFKPTCANSGCHDGHFEPDYRTIGSAYNNMVNHKVLTNDASGSFTYRVKPGDAAKSLVHERLLVALPSTSGIMPAVTTSEWLMNKASHIKGIKDWIEEPTKVHTEMKDAKVTVRGDTAWITYYWEDEGTSKGKAFATKGKSTRIFVKESGKWLCIHGHYTLLEDGD